MEIGSNGAARSLPHIAGKRARRWRWRAPLLIVLFALSGCAQAQGDGSSGALRSTSTSRPAAATLEPAPSQTSPTRTAPPAPTGTAFKQWAAPPEMEIDPQGRYRAEIETTRGTMVFELFAADAPLAVNNFVFLSRQDFYDGVKFHRIFKDYIVQTGDPTGTGTGGPGYTFEDEPVTRDYLRGTLAMANAGPHTNGSQFFIMHADYAIAKTYTIFGQLISGHETLDKIASSPVRMSESGEASEPIEAPRIRNIEIVEE